MFIDETAVTTKMVRHYGRAPRGKRLVAKAPHGHWKTLTFIAALRIDGLTAPYVVDGAVNGMAVLSQDLGAAVRAPQTGRIRMYVTVLMIAVTLGLAGAIIIVLSR